ncbi:MAG: 23S rRNA (adenine(2503)-C(2))-methyltransferase RlmN [Rhodospirillales bacterium]|nr:23S rRNA (adenine(2503)-C(2))-methyltransferase RlmN [Rhodospirillales bacterium]
MSDGRTNLIGLPFAELTREIESVGEPAYRARQIWHWLYDRGATDFESMTSIAKKMRPRLEERFTIKRPEIAETLVASDGTRKWLLRLEDGNEVETVFIPEADRGALCVSSQVGCTLSCSFCRTGTQKLVRNLTAGEIIGQVLIARDALGEWPSTEGRKLFTNIVMMGMGEPLYNFENVAPALRLVMSPEGIAISRRRITLSTSGVVPMIPRAGAELGVNLAVSLHAVRDDIRDKLVPINRKWPIKELLAACREYPGLHNARRMTFEYVMLKGINDSAADAHELVRLVEGIPAKFNLIPFNPWPGVVYECSAPATIEAFATILNGSGYSAPVRTPRGRDIMAACGQLRSESLRRRASAEAVSAPA